MPPTVANRLFADGIGRFTAMYHLNPKPGSNPSNGRRSPAQGPGGRNGAGTLASSRPEADEIQPRVRLVDIAQLAGVSRSVAGQVLNGGKGNSRVGKAAAERVQKIAKKMRYRPNLAARHLRGKRTQTFGVLVSSAGDPLRSFLVQYLDMESVKVGCHTLIGNTIGSGEPNYFGYYIGELAHRGVDGVFCAVHDWFEGDRRELVRQHPNTVFYENPGLPGACYVQVDRSHALRLAMEHLVSRGRRRIGLALSGLGKPSCQARKRGYLDGLAAHGLPGDESLIFSGDTHGPIYARHDEISLTWDYPLDAVDASIDRLVCDGGADAIIAHDDFWAASLIKRLRIRGLAVPRDVAVVGYLNHYLADWIDPALTTIDLHHELAARRMVELMERLICEEAIPEQDRMVTIEPRLIVREST